MDGPSDVHHLCLRAFLKASLVALWRGHLPVSEPSESKGIFVELPFHADIQAREEPDVQCLS